MRRLTIIFALVLPLAAAFAQTSESEPKLRELLKAQPESDLNRDGVLTLEEALAWQKQRKARPASAAKQAARRPAPTYSGVSYGPHPRNVLDFWKAESDKPTPLVVFIHGGGFVAGDKSKGLEEKLLPEFLQREISFASISYRYRTQAPIQDVLRDTARSIQFLRHHAARFNIDKRRVGAYGGSAGAGSSLWIAFHDDLADPGNPDPVLRESSRIQVAGSRAGQFTYDVPQWKDALGVPIEKYYSEDARFYGLKSMAELDSDQGRRIRADVDMRGLISKDDPPVFLYCRGKDAAPSSKSHYMHHPRHSMLLKQRLDEMGVPSVMYLQDAGSPAPGGVDQAQLDFFLRYLAN